MASQSTLLGAAGEHLVMSELLRRGFIAALAPVGVPNVDILVTDREGARLCSIQVKTRRGDSDGGWYMNKKHEESKPETFFYCFVDFGNATDRPKLFIMPSAKVAEVLRVTHRQWWLTREHKGQKHENGALRRLRPNYAHIYGAEPNPYPAGWLDHYRDAWKLRNLEPKPEEVEARAD